MDAFEISADVLVPKINVSHFVEHSCWAAIRQIGSAYVGNETNKLERQVREMIVKTRIMAGFGMNKGIYPLCVLKEAP